MRGRRGLSLMVMRLLLPLLLLPLLFCPPVAKACIWDSDTLAMEKARFPGVFEVLTGQFPRHSRAFYEWRVKQCEAALAKDGTQAAVYDDLAVARHKLGNHKGAIATMQAKEKVKPGLYETYSNLGTFYIYTGELKEAVGWIDKALAVNADAHFGREKYQKWLVEWVLAGKPAGEQMFARGYAGYVVQKASPDQVKQFPPPKLMEEARTGVLGMMRFADFDNPLLQEALGDILVAGELENAGHLAAQAYLMALMHVKRKDEMPALQKKFQGARKEHTGWDQKEVQNDLKAGMAKGVALTEQVAKDEAGWIKEGKDAAAAFTQKYLTPGEQKAAP